MRRSPRARHPGDGTDDGAELVDQRLGLERLGEVVALGQLAAERPQAADLLSRLDTLGDDLEAERPNDLHDDLDHGQLTNTDAAHEGPVDLELGDGEALE